MDCASACLFLASSVSPGFDSRTMQFECSRQMKREEGCVVLPQAWLAQSAERTTLTAFPFSGWGKWYRVVAGSSPASGGNKLPTLSYLVLVSQLSSLFLRKGYWISLQTRFDPWLALLAWYSWSLRPLHTLVASLFPFLEQQNDHWMRGRSRVRTSMRVVLYNVRMAERSKAPV